MLPISHKPRPEDIFSWCDGTRCYRSDFEEMSYMSDDFLVLYIDTDEYNEFMGES